jgi:hypothetical protein
MDAVMHPCVVADQKVTVGVAVAIVVVVCLSSAAIPRLYNASAVLAGNKIASCMVKQTTCHMAESGKQQNADARQPRPPLQGI